MTFRFLSESFFKQVYQPYAEGVTSFVDDDVLCVHQLTVHVLAPFSPNPNGFPDPPSVLDVVLRENV